MVDSVLFLTVLTYFVAVQIVLLVRIFLTNKAYYHYFKKIIKGRYCEIPLITTALITTTTTTIPSVSSCQIDICQNFGQCLGRLFSVSNYKKIKNIINKFNSSKWN
jgi:hypothetical protein